MNAEPQNVLDYRGDNTIFLVWNFKKDQEIGAVFQRICALAINLNNSGETRFPDSGAACVMGVGYDAWLRLGLPVPLPKELKNFVPIAGEKHIAVATRGDLHFHIKGSSGRAGIVAGGAAFAQPRRLQWCLANLATAL